MTATFLKRIAALLPARWQAEMKRLHFARQIRVGQFLADEPEFSILPSLVEPGDWVIDIGANVGHYTRRLSQLVGPRGRVFAFEPVPATFSLLASNAELFPYQNTTLINAAASSGLSIATMSVPRFQSGLSNYYRASISAESEGCLRAFTVTIDALLADSPITLIKIDAEGHEASVLKGMSRLISASRPTLIIETNSHSIIAALTRMGYGAERLPQSPNVLFKPDVTRSFRSSDLPPALVPRQGS